jgi:hypothetical protein
MYKRTVNFQTGGKNKVTFNQLLRIYWSPGQLWWHRPIIAVRRRLRQEEFKFQASMGYTKRPCLKKTRQNKRNIGVG